jgi:hypothetical protein
LKTGANGTGNSLGTFGFATTTFTFARHVVERE